MIWCPVIITLNINNCLCSITTSTHDSLTTSRDGAQIVTLLTSRLHSLNTFMQAGQAYRWYSYFQPYSIPRYMYVSPKFGGVDKAFGTTQSSCECTLLWIWSNSKRSFKLHIATHKYRDLFKVIIWLRLRWNIFGKVD